MNLCRCPHLRMRHVWTVEYHNNHLFFFGMSGFIRKQYHFGSGITHRHSTLQKPHLCLWERRPKIGYGQKNWNQATQKCKTTYKSCISGMLHRLRIAFGWDPNSPSPTDADSPRVGFRKDEHCAVQLRKTSRNCNGSMIRIQSTWSVCWLKLGSK
jgi:hypothetical protein